MNPNLAYLLGLGVMGISGFVFDLAMPYGFTVTGAVFAVLITLPIHLMATHIINHTGDKN